MNDMGANDVSVKAEQRLQQILAASESNLAPYDNVADFRKWFLQYFKNENCENSEVTLEKFAVYFLNAVRQQTYKHLCTVESSDEVLLPSPAFVNKQIGKLPPRNKAALPTTPTSCNPLQTSCQNISTAQTKCSTPLQRRVGHRRSIESSFSAASDCSYEKSRNSTSDGSFCLGDFIVSSPNLNSGRHGNSLKKRSHLQQQTIANTTITTTATPKTAGGNKPKKRVVPISIGGGKTTTQTASGDSSSPFSVHDRSFDRELNNIFMHSPTMEISDLAETRKSLKRDLNKVSTALKASTPTKTPTKVSDITQAMQQVNLNNTDESICLQEISNDTRSVLRLLANIYGLLIDMGFVINILNEFTFLINLLNANMQNHQTKVSKEFESLIGIRTLTLTINSIYFAVCVLEFQQETLAQLDTKSLGVVLQCERLERFAPLLKEKLYATYEQKQALAYQRERQQVVTVGGSFKNVCFQEDSDSRKFFSSTAEFSAFKTQRDNFYIVLKLWEKHHLNPAWSFNSELASKVRDIFRHSEHPVNMAHFAKLFVSQLLVSASDKTSPEDLGFGNDDVDLQKFNKLSQRLVAPSNFSVDYQFPREQAFFRDFIIESRSLPFMEQLKMVIFGELIMLNDSTLEHINLNLMTASEERDHEISDSSEFIVEPRVLSSMLILAKFLGFVTALPYQGGAPAASTSGEAQNSLLIQRYQLKMRQLFHAPFDVCRLLDVAMANGRLLITLPWLIQYMAMLDAVTLQLNSYRDALQKMFALYAAIGGVNNIRGIQQRTTLPMSSFILRCCLGWLFEQKPVIATEYYNFRVTLSNDSYDTTGFQAVESSLPQNQQTCAVLESILTVACPNLAEFRVSIMPAKHALTKYVSRSGRYRHITPSIAGAPELSAGNETTLNRSTTVQQMNANTPELPTSLEDKGCIMKQRQRRLMESFLHAQNSSIRRLIVFLTERTYKCVIKDAQHQILLPSKAAADSLVNKISSNKYEVVFDEMQSIYRNARAEAIQQWDNEITGMLRQRVIQGLEALLPTETTSVIKKAYAWRIQSDANIKIAQWRHMNLLKHDFYCNDMEGLAEKLCKANTNQSKQKNGGAQQSTELKLLKATPSISDLLEELQHWLYTTSGMSNLNISPEQRSTNNLTQSQSIEEALSDYLSRLTDSFENFLPTIYYRLIGAGVIQVFHHLITSQPAAVTPSLMETFCKFCLDERLRSADECATAHTPQTEQSKNDQAVLTDSLSSSSAVTTIYHALISAPFIQSLSARRICFDKLKALFFLMIRTKIISIDFVNELFIGVFKQDLCQATLSETSRLLSELATEIGGFDVGSDNGSNDFSEDTQKSKLFMEVLADFSRDFDNF